MPKPVILVVDRGAFLPFGQALVPDASVLWFSEFRDVASYAKNAMVGRDVPGMERVDSMWSYIDDVDCVAFPDCGDGDMQSYLREHGYAVWGSGKAEMLELDRYQFRKLLETLDMPVIPYRHVVGLDALRSILRDENDLYVKSSFTRGDLETFGHKTWHLSKSWFTDLKNRLGPHGDEIELIVEEKVPGIEIGFDGWSVDGMFPKRSLWGVELKDQAFVGRVQDVSDMPRCLSEVNEQISESLAALGMRGNFSTEVRVAENGTAYFIDPCCRAGSPPMACLSVLVSNWPEIVLGGSHGELIEGEFEAEYAAEIEIKSEWSTHNWGAIEFPDELAPLVRLRRAAMVDGKWWVVPHAWMNIVGSAVGLGDSPEEAIDAAIDVAEQIEGQDLEWNRNCKDEVLTLWSEAQEQCDKATTKAA